MTRLQRDALRRLAIAVAAGIAVAVIYILTRSIFVSMAGLGVMSLAAFVNLFPAAEPGPIMEPEDSVSRVRQTRWWTEPRWWIRIGVVVIIEAALYADSANPVRPRSTALFMMILPALLLGVWIVERAVQVSRGIPRPKYDERELLTLERAQIAGYGAFWTAFVFWSFTAMFLSHSGAWHLPASIYPVQLLAAVWLILTAHSVSILWHEWRTGR